MSKKKDLSGRRWSKEIFTEVLKETENTFFWDKEDFLDFLIHYLNEMLDDIKGDRTTKEQAQDLVYEAYESSPAKAKKLMRKALKLDAKNVDAHIYFARNAVDIESSIKLYEKAIDLAKEEIGEKIFKRSEGHFWMVTETRPYMRAKLGLAICWENLGKYQKAIEIYYEMLRLNPNDNQGVRYALSHLLLKVGDLEGFKNLQKENIDEGTAIWLFDNALYHFMAEGATALSYQKLKEADEENPHVIDFLLGVKELPDHLPSTYGIGDESEAVIYVTPSLETWIKYGAMDWIDEFRNGRKK